MLAVSNRMSELWEALQLYYFCFLGKEDLKKFGNVVNGLFAKCKENDKCELKKVLNKQRDQNKTNSSSGGERENYSSAV